MADAVENKEEIRKVIEFHAKKLGVLLAISTMPTGVKEAWIALLPQMPLEQIERLLNILEAKYLNEQTRDVDAKFKKEFAEIVKSSEHATHQKNKEFMKKVKSLVRA